MLPSTLVKKLWMKQTKTLSLKTSLVQRAATNLVAKSPLEQWTMSRDESFHYLDIIQGYSIGCGCEHIAFPLINFFFSVLFHWARASGR